MFCFKNNGSTPPEKDFMKCNLGGQPHYFCRLLCRSTSSPNLTYCSKCFNRKYIKNAMKNYKSEDCSDAHPKVALCPLHAYSDINPEKIELYKLKTFMNCVNCKKHLKLMCYICIKYFPKSELKIMHEFHSICIKCYKKKPIVLSCKLCIKDENDTTFKPNFKQFNNFKISEPTLRNSLQGINSLQGRNSNINVRMSEQSRPSYNHSEQEYLNNMQLNYTYKYFCQEHGQSTDFTLVCQIHFWCGWCIFENILKKFRRFVYAIKSRDIAWLNKFHRFGCYNQNCLFADFSFSLHYFKQYLSDHFSRTDPNYLGLLHYFFQFAEGFILNFKLCRCELAVILYPHQICDSCLQNNSYLTNSYGGNLSQLTSLP